MKLRLHHANSLSWSQYLPANFSIAQAKCPPVNLLPVKFWMPAHCITKFRQSVRLFKQSDGIFYFQDIICTFGDQYSCGITFFMMCSVTNLYILSDGWIESKNKNDDISSQIGVNLLHNGPTSISPVPQHPFLVSLKPTHNNSKLPIEYILSYGYTLIIMSCGWQ